MKRSATEEIQEGVRQLHEAVLRLGDAHGALTPQKDAENTAALLAAEAPDAALLAVVAAAVLEQPHKASVYAAMIGALAARSPATAQGALGAVLSGASLDGAPLVHAAQWRHVYAALCLLAHLSRLSIVDSGAFDAAVATLLERAGPSLPCVCWCVLTASMALSEDVRGSLAALTRAACLAPTAGLDVGHWVRGPALVESADAPPVATRLDAQPVAHETFAIASWTQPSALLLVLPWAAGDGPFHDDAAPWEAQAVAASVRATVEALRDNHRRCAEVLMALGSMPGVRSIERLVVSFMLGGIVSPAEHPLLPRAVYETLLVDCCRMAPRSVPSAMARALGLLLRTPGLLSPVAADRLAAWFALHLCTFDLRWNWAQWEDLLAPASAIEDVPPRLFVRGALARLLALSYMERVRPTLPDAFQAVLAAIAAVSLQGDVSEAVGASALLVEKRAEPSALMETCGGRWDVLLDSILRVGTASPGRLQHLLQLYGRLLRSSVPPECMAQALDRLAACLCGPALAMALHFVLTNRVFPPAAVLSWLALQLGDLERLPRLCLPLLVPDLLVHTHSLPDHAAARVSCDAPDAPAMMRAIETMRAEHVSGVRALRLSLAGAASSGSLVAAAVARDLLVELAFMPAACLDDAVVRQAEVAAAVTAVSADVLSLFPE